MAGLLEFLQEYVEQLSELTSPVKAKINSLTMLAAEEAAVTPAAAPSIAAAIEKRINTAPAGQKLPALFLLDSIAKNAREPFIQIFSRNLPEVFLAVWVACPSDQTTLQRVLTTWDRIFPLQPLDAIRRRADLTPTLASAPPGAAAAPQPQPLPAPLVQQPAAPLSAALAEQPAPGTALPAPHPVPMQRDPASLRPAYGQQGQGAAGQPQQLPAPVTLPAPHQPPQPAAGPQRLGPDQIAALREAAAARLAAARAPKPQPQPPHPRGQARGPQQQQRPTVVQQAGGGAGGAPNRSREYEPTMPVAPGGNTLRPEQLSQLEALLKSLAQGGVAAAAAARPAAAQTPSVPPPSLEELWSPAKLKARNPAAVAALLDASAALLPLQLDRAFAARRRVRARGGAVASRPWFPSPSVWLTGAAPGADPGAAFGQQEEAEEAEPQVHSVAADDSRTQCALSGEKFETFWDDELQQWRYRDAKRLDTMEAARYGLAEGDIVLVSALSALEAQPAAAVETASGDATGSVALAEAMQSNGAPADTAEGLAAATEDAAAPASNESAAAADADQHVAAVKAEPDRDLQQPGGVMDSASAEGTAEPDPAATPTAATGSPQPEAWQQNGVADSSLEQLRVGSKRPLEGGPASEGPPVKVKREAT